MSQQIDERRMGETAVREWRFSLDGEWDFRTEEDGQWRRIQVPSPWEAALPELQGWGGVATYRRTFQVPEEWRGRVVRVCLGAVEYWASARINGQEVGKHEGGYTPFIAEIQDAARFGEENVLEVIVADASPTRDVPKPDGTGVLRFVELPHGKQSWYSTVGGIWGSVIVEAREAPFVDGVFITPEIDENRASVRVRLAHLPERTDNLGLRVEIFEPDSDRPVAGVTVNLEAGQNELAFDFDVPNPRLWSPETPNLYRCVATTLRHEETLDSVTERFGMRKLTSVDGKILLNGKPIFLVGALDQDYYPITIYTPPSTDYLRDQFEKAKAMGLNLLRCHIKVPDPRYLELCDELGILVWYEIPNVALLTESARHNVKRTLEEMLERDGNHACIVILTLFNESWGIDLTQAEHRKFLADFYREVKTYERNRLIVDNSACIGNCHVISDLADYHYYYQIPDRADRAIQWLDEFVSRADWVYSSFGDAVHQGEPLVVSEWGNWGLPELTPLLEAYGGDPWWFKFGWGNLVPEGVQDRFRHSPTRELFGDYDTLARWTQVKQYLDMKWQIEEMRLRPQIAGYVITEFQDIDWEVNGMLDYLRRQKVPFEQYAMIQGPDLIIARPDRYSGRPGETVKLDFWLSHWSEREFTHATVVLEALGPYSERWQIEAASIGESANTYPLGSIEIVLPPTDAPEELRLTVRLVEGAETVCRNEIDLVVHPAVTMQEEIVWRDPIGRFGHVPEAVAALGGRVRDQLTEGALLVTTQLDDTAQRHLEQGGRALLIAADSRSVPKRSSISLVDRAEAGRWGDWCSAFVWFKEESPFGEMPDQNRWDFRYQNVVPRRVLEGFSGSPSDMLSGLFVGWLRSEVAITAKARCGAGAVVITTLDLLPELATDVVAQSLFASLVRYARVAEAAIDVHFSSVRTLVSTAEDEATLWRFTQQQPAQGWQHLGFDDSNWREGPSAFGVRRQPMTATGTTWDTPDIWLRKTFVMDGMRPEAGVLRLQHDEDVEVYLNGELILERPGFLGYYEDEPLDDQTLALLREGENVLAVHCNQTSGDQFIDAGIYVK